MRISFRRRPAPLYSMSAPLSHALGNHTSLSLSLSLSLALGDRTALSLSPSTPGDLLPASSSPCPIAGIR